MFVKTFDQMTDWQQHFITSLPRGEFDRVYDTVVGIEPPSLEVEVTVNGVNVDFAHFLEVLERNYDRNVSEAAAELFSEKFNEIHTALDEVGRVVKQAETKVRQELGVEKDSWDY